MRGKKFSESREFATAIRRVKPVVDDTILARENDTRICLIRHLPSTVDPRINRLKKLQSSVKENCEDKTKKSLKRLPAMCVSDIFSEIKMSVPRNSEDKKSLSVKEALAH